MAATKRKNVPTLGQEAGRLAKKSRKSADSNPKQSRFTEEAETDSDPVVESDTGSDSGEDDGVSWPSDGENNGIEDREVGAERDAETIGVSSSAADGMHPTRKDMNKSGKTHRILPASLLIGL